MRVRFDGKNPPHARKRPLHRPSTRRWKLDKLRDAIRDFLETQSRNAFVTVGEVAERFRAKQGLVHQCFHLLNLEGLLEQGSNGLPHDVYRGPPNHHSGWIATFYRLRGKP